MGWEKWVASELSLKKGSDDMAISWLLGLRNPGPPRQELDGEIGG